MKFVFPVVLVACLFSSVRGKVTLTKLEACDPKADYKIKFTASFKNEGVMPLVEHGGLSSKIDIDNNIMNTADVFVFEKGAYKFLIKIKEPYCTSLIKYMGDFASALQKASGLEPGTCPIPKGEYKIENHTLDFSIFKYKDVPEGQFRIKNTLVDSKTEEELGCSMLEFSYKK